jgi:DNA-binding response OmpR family regulator
MDFSAFQHARTHRQLAPLVRRALIVDADPSSARLLGELLREVCQPAVWVAPSNAKALKLADRIEPHLVFCELSAGDVDGLAFTRALRRSDFAARKAPVILVMAEPSPAALLAGRDAGAHEFLRRPVLRKELTRRLEAAILHPRGWVEAVDYVGPDRRRFNSAEYAGPLKRLTDKSGDPHGARVGEALKIVRSALGAIDRDPRQALRALLAQAEALADAAAETADDQLLAASRDLQRYLADTVRRGAVLDAADTGRHADGLLRYAARDARAA